MKNCTHFLTGCLLVLFCSHTLSYLVRHACVFAPSKHRDYVECVSMTEYTAQPCLDYSWHYISKFSCMLMHYICCTCTFIYSVRSPQWLRSKWWALKRHVTNYQNLGLGEILTTLSMLTSSGRGLRPSLGDPTSLDSVLLGNVNKGDSRLTALPGATTFRLRSSGAGYRVTPTIQLADGKRKL